MKVVAVLFAVLAVALAAPPSVQDPKLAVVTKYDNENIGVGEYSFHVEQSDGQIKEEQGQLVNPGSEHEAVAAHGSFSFVGTDGVTYQITYTADENGFQPQGAHIPK